MELRKVLWIGIVLGIASFILGALTCGWLFNWVYSVPPLMAFQPMAGMDTAWLATTLVAGALFGMLYTVVFGLLYRSIPGRGWKKGAWYGLLLWLVGVVPHVFGQYMLLNVSAIYIAYAFLVGLVKMLVIGALLGYMYRPGAGKPTRAAKPKKRAKPKKKAKRRKKRR